MKHTEIEKIRYWSLSVGSGQSKNNHSHFKLLFSFYAQHYPQNFLLIK